MSFLYRQVVVVPLDEIGQAVKQEASIASIHRPPFRSELEGIRGCLDGAINVSLKQNRK